MSLLEIFLLALALAADAFSVATVVGLSSCEFGALCRLSSGFGIFQGLFAALGALLGRFLYEHVSAFDHWVAFGLLEIIGVRMVWQALRGKKDTAKTDPTRGWTLLGLSVAVSIDAFGAGVGMAMSTSGNVLILACLVIAAVAAAATWLGMMLGRSVRNMLGPAVEIGAGVVLILLGIRMLWI
jgi:putative Mn2+ efflux pump MntP